MVWLGLIDPTIPLYSNVCSGIVSMVVDTPNANRFTIYTESLFCSWYQHSFEVFIEVTLQLTSQEVKV